MFQPSVTKISLKTAYLKFYSNLSGVSELSWCPFLGPCRVPEATTYLDAGLLWFIVFQVGWCTQSLYFIEATPAGHSVLSSSFFMKEIVILWWWFHWNLFVVFIELKSSLDELLAWHWSSCRDDPCHLDLAIMDNVLSDHGHNEVAFLWWRLMYYKLFHWDVTSFWAAVDMILTVTHQCCSCM